MRALLCRSEWGLEIYLCQCYLAAWSWCSDISQDFSLGLNTLQGLPVYLSDCFHGGKIVKREAASLQASKWMKIWDLPYCFFLNKIAFLWWLINSFIYIILYIISLYYFIYIQAALILQWASHICKESVSLLNPRSFIDFFQRLTEESPYATRYGSDMGIWY